MARDISKLPLLSLAVSWNCEGGRYTASEQRELEIRMKNEAAVEEARRASSQTGVPRISEIPSDVLLAIIIGLLFGVYLMLDSEFDRLHARYELLIGQVDALDEQSDAIDGQSDAVATQEDVRELNKRLFRIEEHLGIGAGSGGPQE